MSEVQCQAKNFLILEDLPFFVIRPEDNLTTRSRFILGKVLFSNIFITYGLLESFQSQGHKVGWVIELQIGLYQVIRNSEFANQ